jgi:hypothetical protein
MVHQKLHEEKKCTYYDIEFVVKDERNKHAIMMKYGIIYISYISIYLFVNSLLCESRVHENESGTNLEITIEEGVLIY